MILTDIFRLRKPEGTDPVNIQDFNDNFDVIETELNNRPTKTGIASEMTTTFTQAEGRTNLLSGEKLATSLGKIMRWFSDLTTVAFSGKYSDLTDTPSLGSSASAVVIESTEDLAAVTEEGYVVGGIAGAELIKNMGNCTFSVQSDGAYVTYVPTGGADAVTKKLGEPEIVTGTGSGKSYNIGTDYAYVGITSFTATYDNSIGAGVRETTTVTCTYNKSTGVVTISESGKPKGSSVSWKYVAIKL